MHTMIMHHDYAHHTIVSNAHDSRAHRARIACAERADALLEAAFAALGMSALRPEEARFITHTRTH